METLTFKLQEDNFEGPLDLLLNLTGFVELLFGIA